jgi:hypothetical protein
MTPELSALATSRKRELWGTATVWVFMLCGIAAILMQWVWPWLGPLLVKPAPMPTKTGKLLCLAWIGFSAYRGAVDYRRSEILREEEIAQLKAIQSAADTFLKEPRRESSR